jgi:hypothetical protein
MALARHTARPQPGAAPLCRLWLLFFAYAAIVALLVQIVLLPYAFPGLHAGHGLLIGGDWNSFHRQAVELAGQVRADGWSAWRLRPDDLSAPAGISGAIYALTVPEPWTAIPLYAALHATAAIIVLSLVRFFLPNWRQAIWCVLPFWLYPSAMLLYTQIHKDAFSISGALLFLYGWVLLARTESWQGSFWPPLRAVLCIVTGSILAWLVRPYWVQMMQGASVILAVLIAGACIAAGLRRERPRLRLLMTILTACLAVGMVTPLTRGGYSAVTSPYLATSAVSPAVPSTDGGVTASAGAVGSNEAARVASPRLDPSRTDTGENTAPVQPGSPPVQAATASTDAVGASQTAGVADGRRETAPLERAGDSQGAPNLQAERPPAESAADSHALQLGQPTIVILSSLAWRPTPWLPRVLDNGLFTLATVREQARLGYSDAASAIDTDVVLDSASAVIAYLPRAVLIVFLAPFPSDWFGRGSYESTTLMRRVAAGEMLGIYFALAMLPYTLWHWRRRVELWVVLVFCSSMMVIYSLAIPTVGVLYRVRYGFLMTLVALALAGCFPAWAALSPRIHEKLHARQQPALTD